MPKQRKSDRMNKINEYMQKKMTGWIKKSKWIYAKKRMTGWIKNKWINDK